MFRSACLTDHVSNKSNNQALIAAHRKWGSTIEFPYKAEAMRLLEAMGDPRKGFFTKGAKVTFDVRAVAKDRRSLVNASGHGGSVMRDGRVAELCSEYENLLRPRSSLAWNDRGDVWLLTSSSGRPDPPDGLRVGGSTKRQLAQVARSLGATEAVILDGGGSVGLFVHKGRKVNRLDLSAGAYVRPIPVVWTLSR